MPVDPETKSLEKITSIGLPFQEFNPACETIENFIERLDSYFRINGITDDKKVDFLTVLIGPEHFSLLKNRLAPQKVFECSYKDCVKQLCEHYSPTSRTISETFKFHSRKQSQGESCRDFINALKKLSLHCQFGDHLDRALRDQLVVGLNDRSIVNRLLLEDNSMAFERACRIVLDMESASKSATSIVTSHIPSDEVAAVHKKSLGHHRSSSKSRQFSQHHRQSSQHKQQSSQHNHQSSRPPHPGKTSSNKRCGRCYSSHQPINCPALKWSCYTCGRMGHTSQCCKAKVNNYINFSKCNLVTNLENQSPLIISIDVNGIPVEFMVDTGSSSTLVPINVFKSKLSNYQLSKFHNKLTAANKRPVPILGQLNVDIYINNSNFTDMTLLISLKTGETGLLGRDWLYKIYPEWKSQLFHSVNSNVCPELGVSDSFFISSSKDHLLRELSNKYPRVFSQKDNDKPIAQFKVDINLKPGTIPIFCKAYDVPFALRENVKHELNRLESLGIISKIKDSQWASPIVCVPKKSGGLRICVDLKITLNKFVSSEQYPLPKPDEIFHKFNGCNVFCHLDLTNAYLQVQVSDASKHLLAINTMFGLYQYNRLVMGLKTSSANFQSVIDKILVGIDKASAYQDNILIGGVDYNECCIILHSVLSRLEKYNVKINAEKSEFFVKELEFLGHQLSGKGLGPCKSKVKKILDSPCPNDVSQLRSYLGLFNYYHKFTKMSPDVLEPLHRLLRKDVPWKWTKECNDAFTASKQLISDKCLLVLFDPSKEIVLTCDSSSYGVGAVLSHIIDGVECPIAFESATLTPAQRNYCQVQREALSIVFGVTKFHKYLVGNHFTIITDCESLKTIFSETKKIPPIASPRIIRWSLLLSSYDYTIKYKKGSTLQNADMFSRLPVESPVDIENDDCNFIYLSTPLVPVSEVAKHTANDPNLSKIMKFLSSKWNMSEVNNNPLLKKYFKIRRSLYSSEGCLMFGNRVAIPMSLRNKILDILHSDHIGIVRSKLVARSYVWWFNMDQDIESKIKCCHVCQSTQNSQKPIIKSWSEESKPWSRIHVDLLETHKSKMLLIVDSFSKWVECFLMSSTNVNNVIEKLNECFARFSVPSVIVSDNGPPFNSLEFSNYCKDRQVRLLHTAPYNPRSNGLAEREVQSVKKKC